MSRGRSACKEEQGGCIRLIEGGPAIDVRGNSVSIVNGDDTPSLSDHTDFGPALVPGGTVVRTFTVHNRGAGTLNPTGSPRVGIHGGHAADFAVTAQPSASVAPGDATPLLVSFRPAAVEMRIAALSFAHDAPGESPYTFSIRGRERLLRKCMRPKSNRLRPP